MKTLVIHPHDPTTDFLSKIYMDKDWAIIRDNISKSKLRSYIMDHDRIVMLGHGTDKGLMGFDRTFINSKMVQLLHDKQIVAIWCNADVFVNRYNLKGFYTGMIISDYDEALIYSVDGESSDINESNSLLADSIHQTIDRDDMLSKTKLLYTMSDNNIVTFNHDNLFYNG